MDRFATYDFLLKLHSNHGPISLRFRDKWRFQSKITEFAMCMGTTWPLRSGCKIIAYLESQTPWFLINCTTVIGLQWRLRVVYTWALPLLSIFKLKISKSTRLTCSPSRYNFAMMCGIRKPMWWGYKAENKVWRYLYPFQYNTYCDRQTDTLR